MILRIFSYLSVFLFLLSCNSDDFVTQDDNPFLGQSNPNFSLNLDLVTNADLQFAGGELFLPPRIALGTIQGAYIRNEGNNRFVAFDLAEPNSPIGSCTIPNKITGVFLEYTCGEQVSRYNFANGLKEGGEGKNVFPLRRYNVQLSGNTLRVTR